MTRSKLKNKSSNVEIVKWWLNSRGGRTLDDLKKDDLGYYVFMGDGKGGECKVYLPSINIIKEFNS